MRRQLLRTIRAPKAPLARLSAVEVAAFCSKLTVWMEVSPNSIFVTVDVAAFRAHGAVLVIRHEQTMTNPSGAVGSHVPRVAESDGPGLIGNLSKVEVSVHKGSGTLSAEERANWYGANDRFVASSASPAKVGLWPAAAKQIVGATGLLRSLALL